MVTRVEYEKRNRRIIAAARSGADYTDLASRFGVGQGGPTSGVG